MAATPGNAYAESPRHMSPSAFSADGESTYTGNPTAGKVLRIKRVVRRGFSHDKQVIEAFLGKREDAHRGRKRSCCHSKLLAQGGGAEAGVLHAAGGRIAADR